MNLMMLLEMAASGGGDRIALGSGENRLTYQDLFDRAGRAAQRFREADVERVSLVDVSSEAVPIALFGAAWAGLAFVPLSYRLSAGELARLAAEVAPAVSICQPGSLDVVAATSGVTAEAREGFLAGVADGAVGDNDWDMDPEAIAVLLYTSGTTGAPKAAVLRHKHLCGYVLGSVEFMGAAEDEANLVAVPPYHVAGMAAVVSSVFAGRRIVQLPAFDPEAWLGLAQREQVTHAMVVPTMLAGIVDTMERTGATVPSLRSLAYGGGKTHQTVVERALDLFPEADFVNAYGLTETSSTIAVLGPAEHREAHGSTDPAVKARLSGAGKPLPTVEVEIRDPLGDPVDQGVVGEIWVRGDQVSGEYVGQRARVAADGWFPTRDGGHIDADGYLFVDGRVDDVIIRGGENISPGEIEDVLRAHDAVRDAAVVGVPDEHWGERIAAVVVAADGESIDVAGLQTYVRQQLRSSRTPDVVAVRTELPYSETGKLLRRVLRDELSD